MSAICYFCEWVLKLKVRKLFFPESTLILPFWILSFAFVFGSDPLTLIFLVEKSQLSRPLMVCTGCPWREITVNDGGAQGVELGL